MKKQIIFAAFLAIFAFSSGSPGQSLGVSIMPSGDKEVIVAKFPAPLDRRFVIFEAVIPARSASECMASTDFTNAVPVTDGRAVTVVDPTTGFWFLKNTQTSASAESCTVLLVKSSIDTTDLTLWRAHFGSTGLFWEEPSFASGANNAKPQRSIVTSVSVTFSAVASAAGVLQ